VTALSAAIRGLLADDALRREAGKRASERADEFSVEALGRRYRTLLDDIVGSEIDPQIDSGVKAQPPAAEKRRR
jgi:glycosyltransferase involved in cell wall biosynthesis